MKTLSSIPQRSNNDLFKILRLLERYQIEPFSSISLSPFQSLKEKIIMFATVYKPEWGINSNITNIPGIKSTHEQT